LLPFEETIRTLMMRMLPICPTPFPCVLPLLSVGRPMRLNSTLYRSSRHDSHILFPPRLALCLDRSWDHAIVGITSHLKRNLWTLDLARAAAPAGCSIKVDWALLLYHG